MNFAMWRKALNVIPEVSKEEWDGLDVISKWLISTRAAVLVMTFISAALAGLFAWRDGSFSFLPWLALTFGFIFAHASNNIFNDYTDFVRGVDKDNYYRNIYGAQPSASGLMTKRQHLTYFAVTAMIALAIGLYLIAYTGFNATTWTLLGLGWRIFPAVLHLAPQRFGNGRDRSVDRLGTLDDRRRTLCTYR
jgi:1,4-dihydroxy-2-naphthoate octaprenyltransferase